MRLAVFASGNGSNFEAIAKAVQDGIISNTEIVFLFSDKKAAFALQRAKNFGIKSYAFEPKDYADKEVYEKEILKLLIEHQVDYVALAGYMRLIGTSLLDAYEGRIINIHPALLPAFPGLHGIEDAYAAGVVETGVTVHYVDSGVDTGPIIAQEKVQIDKAESLEGLTKRIHLVEHQLFPAVLAKISQEFQNEGEK